MELLKKLYEIHSPSGKEKKIKRFIRTYVAENINGAKIVDNRDGNIYIVKGNSETYPCVVAHLDQVQNEHSDDFMAVETDDIIFGYSHKNRKQEGLGADDKNGIWIALKCLESTDVLKVAFFVGEEIGCVGSRRCDMSFFADCRFVVQPDRKGSSDLITNISGVICSDKFKFDINPLAFGYTSTYGLMTDVLELSERGIGLSCINLSCGYYSPHTDEEFTVKEDILNCLNFVKYIIENCTEVYPHKYDSGYSYSGYKYPYSSYWKDYDDYDDYYGTKSKYDVTVCRASDYATIDDFVYDLIYDNMGYTPDELWPYVASDLETFGVNEEEFMEHAWIALSDIMEEYYNDGYNK